jgi:hypothetical protein
VMCGCRPGRIDGNCAAWTPALVERFHSGSRIAALGSQTTTSAVGDNQTT